MELSTLLAKTKATIAEPDQSAFQIEGVSAASAVIKPDRDLSVSAASAVIKPDRDLSERGGVIWRLRGAEVSLDATSWGDRNNEAELIIAHPGKTKLTLEANYCQQGVGKWQERRR